MKNRKGGARALLFRVGCKEIADHTRYTQPFSPTTNEGSKLSKCSELVFCFCNLMNDVSDRHTLQTFLPLDFPGHEGKYNILIREQVPDLLEYVAVA